MWMWTLIVACAPAPSTPDVVVARHATALDLHGVPLVEIDDDVRLNGEPLPIEAAAATLRALPEGDVIAVAVDAAVPWSRVVPILDVAGERFSEAAFVVVDGDLDEVPRNDAPASAEVRLVGDLHGMRPSAQGAWYVGPEVRLMGVLSDTGGGALFVGADRPTGQIVHVLDVAHGVGARCWAMADDPEDTHVGEVPPTAPAPRAGVAAVIRVPLGHGEGGCTIRAGGIGPGPPVPAADRELADATGTLAPAVLQEALTPALPDLRACAAPASPAAARIDIGASGRFIGGVLTATGARRGPAERCLARRLLDVSFPPSEGASRVLVVLDPSRDGAAPSVGGSER